MQKMIILRNDLYETKTWMDYFLSGRVFYLRREWDSAVGVFEEALGMVPEESLEKALTQESPVFSILPFWAKAGK